MTRAPHASAVGTAAPLLALTLLLTGCVIRTPSDPAAPPLAAHALDWPSRDRAAVRAVGAEAPGLRDIAVQRGGMVQGQLRFVRVLTKAPLLRADACGLGAVREFGASEQPTDGPHVTSYLQFVSSWSRRASPSGRADPFTEGAAFKLWRPAKPSRGVVIQLQSLGGDDFERPVIEALLERGWAVLESPFPWGPVFGLPKAKGTGDVPGAAGKLAAHTDQRLAEWAFGAEAVLEYLGRHRPEVGTEHVVVIGFSLGALGAPTVAARLGGRVDALVVGGGADLCSVMTRTTLEALRISHDPSQREALRRVYLEQSSLDPYHAAVHVEAATLLVHAAFDRIVPAATGDTLHERLGRPERWTMPVGHEGMFLLLPALAGDVADWVDTRIRREAGTG